MCPSQAGGRASGVLRVWGGTVYNLDEDGAVREAALVPIDDVLQVRLWGR